MARWRLTAPHYLNVPGTEWEHKETDQSTGKQARKVFLVPALLNPDTASDCNYPGEIIVCYDGKGQGRDIVFEGDPTPDMEPLDEEAEAISATFRAQWQHPIESLAPNGESYSSDLLRMLEAQLLKAGKGEAAQAVPNSGVSREEFEALQAQLAALMAQNAELTAAKPGRRA